MIGTPVKFYVNFTGVLYFYGKHIMVDIVKIILLVARRLAHVIFITLKVSTVELKSGISWEKNSENRGS